jgi:hypothetical protein
MISNLLLGAELFDSVANPFRTIEEHELGAARLALLASRGLNVGSLEETRLTDLDLVPGHIWRWALNEAKEVEGSGARPGLPNQEVLEALFLHETDLLGRLLYVEAVVTHPQVEREFRQFEEQREPSPLEQLPNVWPRNYLIELSRGAGHDSETEAPDLRILELGMILLQIGTPAALALLGGMLLAVRRKGEEENSLLRYVRAFAEQDEELGQRLGLHRSRDRFD